MREANHSAAETSSVAVLANGLAEESRLKSPTVVPWLTTGVLCHRGVRLPHTTELKKATSIMKSIMRWDRWDRGRLVTGHGSYPTRY